VVRIQCAFPGCPETLVKTGKSLYCIDHKSLTARERGILMKSKKQATPEPVELIKAAIKAGFVQLFPEGVPADVLDVMAAAAAKGNYLLWAEEEGILPELIALARAT
jgi:hypothetical protein